MVHPFDQLTADEAKKAVQILRKANEGSTIYIKSICAQEPPKKAMVDYLEAEHAGSPIAPPPRVAYCLFYTLERKKGEQMWIDVDAGDILKRELLPKGQHLPGDATQGAELRAMVMSIPEVQDALKQLKLTKEEIDCVEPESWTYGCDSYEEMPQLAECLMYMRDPKKKSLESNIYGRPLPFVVVFDVFNRSFRSIDWCATGADEENIDGFNYNTRNTARPISQNFDGGQEVELEYDPALMKRPLRTDLKPYNVIQPEGPSFTTNGTEVRWQKWSFRLGFNPREGPVLYDVRYENRQTFYRIAFNEMAVPYGHPAPPLHRKQAFDFGDAGAGNAANSLGLGCDCLGVIKYFDGVFVKANGDVEVRPNVLCMHEQDDGLLLKHTTGKTGKARVSRRRILVLQMVFTLANYEYILMYNFDQAGAIDCEVRATGIVSTQYIDPNKQSRYGNLVAPSTLAPSHQHVFNIRIDPAIDGHRNTVQMCETKVPPISKLNPKGTAFYNEATNIETSTAFDADIFKNRFVKIVNENVINPVSKRPIGYKFMGSATPLIMPPEGSVARDRARFGTHHYWVTKYRDNELYAGGPWTNQASVERGGVTDAVNRKESVRNDDVVLWHSFSLLHHVRVEDFPVMPIEKIHLHLVPYDFFTFNPAIDVPPSEQSFNRSVEIKDCRSCQRL